MVGETVLQHTSLPADRRTASTMTPAIGVALQWCRDHQCWPEFISVADGPGSFTGLRIGVTTAKTLGYALGLPVIGVDSVATIAAAAMFDAPRCDQIIVGLDAYRGQVFAGQFDRSQLLPPLDQVPGDWSPHPPSVRVISHQQWAERCTNRLNNVDVAGDIKPLGEFAAVAKTRTCDAIGVGMLAIRAAAMGRYIDAMTLQPRYLKASAAEEKAAHSTTIEKHDHR